MPISRERWQDFHQSWQAMQDASAQIADRWHRGADALSQMMINTGFVLNAGGILAVPALHQFLNGEGRALPWERTAAVFFFLGIIATAASGFAAIWNYRMMGEQINASNAIDLKELEEKWHAEQTYEPSEELRRLREAPLIGAKSIPRTFILGWGFGMLAYGLFLAGGMTIAWSANRPLTPVASAPASVISGVPANKPLPSVQKP